MKKTILLLVLAPVLLFGKVRVVAAITDLADITRTIGGQRVKVSSITRGNQDPHYVEVLPSYMIKVKQADIYLKAGLELDLWSQKIIDGSRNRKLRIIDCSTAITRLEVPTERVDARLGDIHRYGNPHYWLDPANGKLIAATIARALIAVDPAGRGEYESNLERFYKEVDAALKRWGRDYSGLEGKRVIFYHNSWPYFSQRFGLVTVAFLEPKPGITPSPAHLERLIKIVAEDNIGLIAMESYYNTLVPDFLSQKTGLPVVKLAQSVGALPGVDSYLEIFDYNLRIIQEILVK